MLGEWNTVLDEGAFRIRLAKGDQFVLELTGVLREAKPARWLDPALAMLTETPGDAIIDVRALEYMNATAFRLVASWLKQEGTTLPGRLVLRTSEAHRWQKMAVPALRGLVGQRLEVEEEPA